MMRIEDAEIRLRDELQHPAAGRLRQAPGRRGHRPAPCRHRQGERRVEAWPGPRLCCDAVDHAAGQPFQAPRKRVRQLRPGSGLLHVPEQRHAVQHAADVGAIGPGLEIGADRDVGHLLEGLRLDLAGRCAAARPGSARRTIRCAAPRPSAWSASPARPPGRCRAGRDAPAGLKKSSPVKKVRKMFQPPWSGGFRLARRVTTLPQSVET